MFIDRLTSLATPPRKLSRRTFLAASAAAGRGLLLSVALPTPPSSAAAADSFARNGFIRIGRDGKVTLVMPYVEMGQGTYTSISMLIAEELEVGLDQVQPEHAPGDRTRYGNPLVGGEQATGGSTAVR